MIGSPTAIGLIATLWPAGIRSTVVTPSATAMPGGRLERAISTPSSGCRRMTGAGVAMGYLRASYVQLNQYVATTAATESLSRWKRAEVRAFALSITPHPSLCADLSQWER